jgi:hypothetical protein
MTNNKPPGCFIAVWIAFAIAGLALWATIIWGVITLVLYVTR